MTCPPVAIPMPVIVRNITRKPPVITAENLPMCAGFAARAGLPMEEAWKAITINPARHLGIEDRVGSIEVGKDADFVVCDRSILDTQNKIEKMTAKIEGHAARE